ncbi:Eco57I restriction-modification methylase domain-containing protein [Halochromatium roseum]|uniref:Eco57I restriction-modification methylase domain-containing protein n=1 Tax=Halochromatium roseum TaxID=391920 RepID=UPI001911605F|nr:DNA methyltransferase [Halochromatium roseum]MBK5939643.1 hypothetical protein [Halochromatium roseum]
MDPLAKPLRRQLEDAIVKARDLAEQAAQAALQHLGVGDAEAPPHLTDSERALRRRLRAHGRQLGDQRAPNGVQAIEQLAQETAYEHWHRMLFARFLAENQLLMHPEGVPLSLAECQELAQDEGAANGWELAGRYAARMLPQIFRPDSPVLALDLAPEHQRALERLLANLAPETFHASDGLGWVYQFWQTRQKDRVNASEVKIGARELPAVTQLFTEPYMVAFLLDNSLGAWWAARQLSDADRRSAESEEALRRKAAIPGVPLEYLRFVRSEAEVVRASSPESPGQDGLTTQPGIDEQTLTKTRGEHLPHWTCDNAIYHVVFRLADSIPRAKLDEWTAAREARYEQARSPDGQLPEPVRRQANNEYQQRIDTYLDAGHGACWLKRPENAQIVADALQYFDQQRYRLHVWCVMPTHVHVIVEPLPGHALSKILHSWKSFTASAINRHLNRTGAFWQEDAYNHIIRSDKEYGFQVRYVWHNPDKAGLPDWPWRGSIYADAHANVARASSPDNANVASSPDTQDSSGQDGLTTYAQHWTTAAGTFDAWPARLGELKLMDPCCGSGHFLVAALQMLVPMRMALEGLDARAAIDAVLRDNLHGLELDQRCVEIAAFALALTAWRWPDAGGYRPLPALNLACSGLGIHASKADWLQLAEGDVDLQHALERIYELFQDASTLGSLIDPRRAFRDDDLIDLGPQRGWERVAPLVERALASEDEQQRELGVVAAGLARAAQLLADRYHWVITNVPYLSRGKQSLKLRDYCETRYTDAKNDLANVFLERCLEFTEKDGSGVVQVVMPQNWLFLASYRKQRKRLLRQTSWNLIARLGMAAFQVMDWWAFNVILLTQSRTPPDEETGLRGIDASESREILTKSSLLQKNELYLARQLQQLKNPDSRVAFEDYSDMVLLANVADYGKGSTTGDGPRFILCFWEFPLVDENRVYWLNSPVESSAWSGRSQLCKVPIDDAALRSQLGCRIHGQIVFGRNGVAVSKMRKLEPFLYSGEVFDDNICPIAPSSPSLIPTIWAFLESGEYHESVRAVDQALKVTAATLTKVPFEQSKWESIAAERYPNGLPKPYSDDPTQWIFHGHPCASVIWDEQTKWTAIGPKRTDASVLQVAVARLLGYRWPAEFDCGSVVRASSPEDSTSGLSGQDGLTTSESESESGAEPVSRGMELSDESRQLLAEARQLDALSDDDGIVCLPALRGEPAAHERLLNLLIAAYGEDWTTGTLSTLLQAAGAGGKSLEVWLRDSFFEQHCKLFQHRPFIWHIWDGLKDGFAALVNYHQLDRAKLERLIYTYLDDWIRLQQRAGAGGGANAGAEIGADTGAETGADHGANARGGADERLAAARALKTKLEAILDGEAPLDIFVRWKPLAEQPIGWNPDLNDGVRLNIRPFLLAGDVGKKGAGVLRAKPNIKWTKDRGKDVESAPWFPFFNGERINDHHLTLAEKRAARGDA